MKNNIIIQGDCLDILPTLDAESIDCCITSPPYWGLRDYGVDGQLGMEERPEQYVESLVKVFQGVKRVLKKEGTLWLNLGDTYSNGGAIRSTGRNDTDRETPGGKGGSFRGGERLETKQQDGLKPKDLVGIPWRVAFDLQADGWWLRQDIIWSKPSCMPESVTDRCTKSHEYIFLLAKSREYYYDHEAIKEPVKQDWGTRNREQGKYHNEGTGLQPHSGLEKSYEKANKRSVWAVNTKPFKEAHFATFPEALIEPMVKAGCPEGGLILDPFFGAGTTGLVAKKLLRKYIGIELNPKYIEIAEKRLEQEILI